MMREQELLKSPLKEQAAIRVVLMRLWLFMTMIEALIAALILVSTPGDPANAFLLGLSKDRWLLLSSLLSVVAITGFLTVRYWRKNPRRDRAAALVVNLLENGAFYYGLIVLSLASILVLSQLIYFSTVVSDPYVAGYMERLRPLLILGLAISFQSFWILPLMRYGLPVGQKIIEKKVLVASLAFFGILLLFGGVVAISGVGITPDQIGWDAPGVPVLIYQVGLAWISGLVFLGIRTAFMKIGAQDRREMFLDILVSLVLWGLAMVFWAREPLVPAFFNPDPRAPNYEYYPHSDAALHDTTAQSLLIGSGFPGIARKPLYALFLALLHSIAGQDYGRVVFLQVVFLAFFPVLLYWLTKRLHHRVSALIAAVLIIIRETNAIRLAGVIGVSHAKMLMSDLPATVVIVLITWLLVTWIQERAVRRSLPLVIGGCLGLLLLLRPQTTVLVPFVFVLVILVNLKKPRLWLVNTVLVALGLSLILVPWLVRSYTLTGEFALNDPAQNAFLTQQYHQQPGTEILKKSPGESQADFIQRVNQYLADFVRENPGLVAHFITSHFMHNQVEMLQALPVSYWLVQNPDSDLFPYWRNSWSRMWGECCSVFAYINRIGYWDPLREPIRGDQFLPLATNLFWLAIGFGVMWLRRDIFGWVPLFVSLVYNFSTSVGRYSGWRLILPADWVVFLYLAVGLGQAALWIYAFFGGKVVSVVKRSPTGSPSSRHIEMMEGRFPLNAKLIAISLVLLGLGLVPLVVDKAVPPRYPAASKSDLTAMAAPLLDDETRGVTADDDSLVLQGRALYPRFYKAGEGEPGDGWLAFSEQNFSRLGFILLTATERVSVVLPRDEPPETFPNASDVIVVGCQSDGYFEAVSIAILDESHPTAVRSSRQDFACPLPTPAGDP
jgi:hypothetical protein